MNHDEKEAKGDLLVVDDTFDNLQLLVKILTSDNYTVRSVSSGIQALVAVQERKPDIILLDIMMPEMDGYEVCQLLKADERTENIPIIFLSFLDEVFDKMKAFSVGGVDYITKPFQAKEVLARVENHITIRRLQQELKDANTILEEKVRDRTSKLIKTNRELRSEIEQRKRSEQEKDKLFEFVQQQSEHLNNITQLFLKQQRTYQQGLASTMHEQIGEQLNLVKDRLKLIRCALKDDRQTVPAVQVADEYLKQAVGILAEMQHQTKHVNSNLSPKKSEKHVLLEDSLFSLSPREREVLQLIISGKSRSEIAQALVISPGTVSTYRRRIMDKLDVQDVAGLISFIINNISTASQQASRTFN